MAGPNLPSALLVEVPEAEPLVRQWRMDLDPHAALGVPAHITVLFPFAPPPLISDERLEWQEENCPPTVYDTFQCG